MAALVARTASCAPVATRPQRQAVKVSASLRPSVKASPAVSTASANQMMIWQTLNNKQFETFSYLPPLTSAQISKQVDYIVANGWIPALEFADPAQAYVNSESALRFGTVSCNYYDNRYWTMWKLPMFGCTDPSSVLTEIARAGKAFPNTYIRLIAFDPSRQVQVVAFLVQRPKSAVDYCELPKRSVPGQ